MGSSKENNDNIDLSSTYVEEKDSSLENNNIWSYYIEEYSPYIQDLVPTLVAIAVLPMCFYIAHTVAIGLYHNNHPDVE